MTRRAALMILACLLAGKNALAGNARVRLSGVILNENDSDPVVTIHTRDRRKIEITISDIVRAL